MAERAPPRSLERFDVAAELDPIPARHNPRGYVWTAPRYSVITHATFRAHRTKPDSIDLHSARPRSPEGRVLRFKVPFIHTKNGAFFRASKESSAERAPPRSLERFDVASELNPIPPRHNPRGYVWTAPRYSVITHATFRAHRAKPDSIDLHSARPRNPEGRVLRFKVPFIHTTSGAFFRPPPGRARAPS